MRNKLALGTVQFGMRYGINNTNGQVSGKEIEKILEEAKKNKVIIIDTAQAYGNSEETLGVAGVEEFNVITKFSAIKNGNTLYDTILSSLKNLRIQNLYGILFHHFDYWQQNPELWLDLQKIKNTGSIKKIGFSLYHPDQWTVIKKQGIIPDLLQIPVNLLNQQFIPYLSEFKQAGIEVHVRSAFLQGLLLMDTKKLPYEFSEIKLQLEALKKMSQNLSISNREICLLWLWKNPNIDNIVIGVDSALQWQQNISAGEWCEKNLEKIKINASAFICNNDNIINPSKWKKK
jgi:aryl-alcohol dehydrogenase-like predicted oxidoreductase